MGSSGMPVRSIVALLVAALFLVPAGIAFAPPVGAPVAPGLAAAVAGDPSALVDAFVTLDDAATASDVAAAEAAGVDVLRVYPDFGLLYVAGPGERVLGLADLPGVVRLTGNEKIHFALSSATVATRAREAWDARSTSTTPAKVGGVVVDGTGVGVAVVDSGADATHPDLAPAIVENKKFALCATPGLVATSSGTCYANFQAQRLAGLPLDGCADLPWVDATDTDTTSGHGTHVSGIVAGRGVASGGRHVGAAPGASVYALGVGDGDSILFGVEAFNWVHCNHASVSPAIRIVTNSWGRAAAAHDPDDPVSVAANRLVSDGLVVLFAAGNAGGTGSANTVGPEARNPTPGVISVAAYDDEDRATRDGGIASFSSRGKSSDPAGEAWPDVAAPGVDVASARAKTGAVTGSPLFSFPAQEHEPYYMMVSGTSQATPHVAGIAALLLQADPTLTPAQVEDVLEDTASKVLSAGTYVADPGNPTTTQNHAAGHGLVDAIAALHDARVGATGGSTLARLSTSPHVYAQTPAAGADGQIVHDVQWTEVAGQPVALAERFLTSGGTPVAVGTPFRFVVDGVPNDVLGTTDTDVTGGPGGVQARFLTTLAAGTHTVEVQIKDGAVWRAFDGFTVTAK